MGDIGIEGGDRGRKIAKTQFLYKTTCSLTYSLVQSESKLRSKLKSKFLIQEDRKWLYQSMSSTLSTREK